MRSLPRWTALLAALAPLLAACGAAEPQPAWPAGTVLALDGAPIDAREVDEVASWFAWVEPQDSLNQLRRLALARHLFPRHAARRLDPAARERELARAGRWREALVAGTADESSPDAVPEARREGRWQTLGPAVFDAACELADGAWSPVVESVGSFHVFQVVERSAGGTPGLVVLTLRVYDFPWLDPGSAAAAIEAELDRCRLVFVDEAWRDAVPTWWQHRLHATSSS